MNKYIIPVCDLIDAQIWLHKISARTISECQEKLMQHFMDVYNVDCDDYRSFLDVMDKKCNISIGEIIDIETL